MTETPDTEAAAQRVRAMAQARGLDRAYALDPELIAAALARGVGSLGPLPAEFSAVTEPAVSFDPAKCGDGALAISPSSPSPRRRG